MKYNKKFLVVVLIITLLLVICIAYLYYAFFSSMNQEELYATPQKYMVNNEEDVEVRKEPSIFSEKLGDLEKGTNVNVNGYISSKWYLVDYYGETGYVSTKNEAISEYTPNAMYIETITEENIIVEGLDKTYQFLYLTDNHLLVKSENDDAKVKEESEKSTGFVNSSGIQSVDAFPYWIEYANVMNVDALLMGGDMLAYPTPEGVAYMKDQFSMLDSAYVYTMGNHDWSFSWDYHTPASYDSYMPLFDKLISVLEYDDLIILSVDNSTNQLNPNSLETFQQYYDKGKPMIVLFHVPLSTESVESKSNEDWGWNISIGTSGIVPNEVTTTFLDMIYAENSPVVGILSGHIHTYDRSTLSQGIVQIVGDDGYGGNGVLLTVSPKE